MWRPEARAKAGARCRSSRGSQQGSSFFSDDSSSDGGEACPGLELPAVHFEGPARDLPSAGPGTASSSPASSLDPAVLQLLESPSEAAPLRTSELSLNEEACSPTHGLVSPLVLGWRRSLESEEDSRRSSGFNYDFVQAASLVAADLLRSAACSRAGDRGQPECDLPELPGTLPAVARQLSEELVQSPVMRRLSKELAGQSPALLRQLSEELLCQPSSCRPNFQEEFRACERRLAESLQERERRFRDMVQALESRGQQELEGLRKEVQLLRSSVDEALGESGLAAP